MPGVHPQQAVLDNLAMRARAMLIMADQELAHLQTDVTAHAKLLSESSLLSLQIATSSGAQKNLHELSRMANRLGDAYINSSYALQEYAEASKDLRTINVWLSFFYLALAVSKVLDIVASVTGTGKLITSAKTALSDMGETYANTTIEMEEKKKDFSQLSGGTQASTIAMEAARAKDLQLVLLKWSACMECIDEVQAVLSAVIDICKDGAALLKTFDDLAKLKSDLLLWSAKLGEKAAKLTDALGKAEKLYETVQSFKKKYNAGTLFDAKIPKDYQMKTSDYFSVVKYAIEAAVNLVKMAASIKDTVEDWKTVNAALGQASNQLAGLGTGRIDTDIQKFGLMSKSDLINIIHQVSSGPDAREMAYNTGTKAQRLATELQRMTMLYQEINSKLAPAYLRVHEDIVRLTQIDEQLSSLRMEFESLRDVDLMRTAIYMDVIDREKRSISAGVNGK